MDSDVKSAGPGESITRDLEYGTPTVFCNNRPVKFRIEMTNGSALEGIIPANTDFIVTLQPGDITKFEIIVEDIPREPAIVE
ncbi:hypothetical protein SE915_14015 [Klebsiella pneumoniae]|uniref:hypothetical protein n=1 Tax=Klebsiella TaxID=570 RepID=UPI0006DA9D0C|nr:MULTISPECIES: hypothetical protein [Klebsiella]QBP28412.1 hypothetical protein [Klebsiella phage ST101-KPC2phi6.1]ATO01501.1 hypothetical protein AN676_0323575 [Klebsiella pneumoniae subsp. pneumoniae]ATO07125.1 hypothetical protein AN663_23285 [Klebsiella pneumoniae subsp. pneumoniae]EMC8204700.1 hypothetical protein [Klebsiella pneumoniae]KAB1803883.1 hypothetical protein FXO01_06080 [Klebsiella pneumoniae]